MENLIETYKALADETRLRILGLVAERLRRIPAQRKKRVVVLRKLLERFARGRTYSEREVNELLGRAHEDVATLRRELVMYGFLKRERGVYGVAEQLPEYSRNVAQEL